MSGTALRSFPIKRLTTLVVCVLLLAMMLTWAYLSMRSVMDVGGSCADGGPYVSAQPCPDGAGFIGAAIPVMILATFAGSGVALSLSVPTLILPMWGLLFGALGWNFLEYGFGDDGTQTGFVVCGVVFWLMALPALIAMVRFGGLTITGKGTATRQANAVLWWGIYASLGLLGLVLGAWSFYSWR